MTPFQKAIHIQELFIDIFHASENEKSNFDFRLDISPDGVTTIQSIVADSLFIPEECTGKFTEAISLSDGFRISVIEDERFLLSFFIKDTRE